MICAHCKLPLVFTRGQSWRHPGGALYMKQCLRCRIMSDLAADQHACPDCGQSDRWVDDHCALAVPGPSELEAA